MVIFLFYFENVVLRDMTDDEKYIELLAHLYRRALEFFLQRLKTGGDITGERLHFKIPRMPS